MAAHANPNSLAGERFRAQAELHRADHPVVVLVHGLDKGATVAAVPGLAATIEAGAAARICLSGEARSRVAGLYRVRGRKGTNAGLNLVYECFSSSCLPGVGAAAAPDCLS